jgi:acetyl-CoA carboxylase biotin carboxyl carrier protein
MAKSKKTTKTSTTKKTTSSPSNKSKKNTKKSTKAAPKASASRKASPGLLGDVENLMQLMAENDVTEINVEDGERKIVLKRGSAAAPTIVAASPAALPAGTPAAPPASAPAAAPTPEEAPPENLLEITSPMVGTFYAAPSPDSDPYVQVGATVNDNTVVCILEAMKVMNEIKAECSGTIAEVCVKNAQAVEFGQVLFKVRPN